MAERLGDGPIEERYRQTMNIVAKSLDEIFNGKGRKQKRKTGFILLVFPFDNHGGKANYISNGANRKDVVAFMKHQIARFEGQPPSLKGKA